MNTLPIRINRELVERVRKYAKGHEMKPSYQRVIELAISEYLSKKEQKPIKEDTPGHFSTPACRVAAGASASRLRR